MLLNYGVAGPITFMRFLQVIREVAYPVSSDLRGCPFRKGRGSIVMPVYRDKATTSRSQ